MKLGDHLLSCKTVGRCFRLTSWGFSDVSASFSHRCRSGFSLHMFLKLSCRASKRQMVVWLNILPTKQTETPSNKSSKIRTVNLKAKSMTSVGNIATAEIPVSLKPPDRQSWSHRSVATVSIYNNFIINPEKRTTWPSIPVAPRLTLGLNYLTVSQIWQHGRRAQQIHGHVP